MCPSSAQKFEVDKLSPDSVSPGINNWFLIENALVHIPIVMFRKNFIL